MEEEKKKQIAAFRFGVIHDLVGHVALEPGEQERLIREKCGRKVGDSVFREDVHLTKHYIALGQAVQRLGRQARIAVHPGQIRSGYEPSDGSRDLPGLDEIEKRASQGHGPSSHL